MNTRYGKVSNDPKNEKKGEVHKSDKTWEAISFLMDHSSEKNAKVAFEYYTITMHHYIVEHQDKYGFTVLHHAVYRGNLLAVQHLLAMKEAKADEADEQGNTALHLAAQGDHRQICDVLMDHKEGVRARNRDGLTPLHLAASAGSIACIKALLHKEQPGLEVGLQHRLA